MPKFGKIADRKLRLLGLKLYINIFCVTNKVERNFHLNFIWQIWTNLRAHNAHAHITCSKYLLFFLFSFMSIFGAAIVNVASVNSREWGWPENEAVPMFSSSFLVKRKTLQASQITVTTTVITLFMVHGWQYFNVRSCTNWIRNKLS